MNETDRNPRTALWLNIALVASAILAFGAVTRNVVNALAPPLLRPVIVCDDPEWKIGAVKATAIMEHTFTLWNRGRVPMTISRIGSDCHCTTILPSEFPQIIQSGEALPVKVRLDLKRLKGEFIKRIAIASDDPQRKTIVLNINGAVIGEHPDEPTSENSTTEVQKGEVHSTGIEESQ